MQEKNITKSINFSKRLTELIKSAGLTQIEAARKLEVSQATINFWMNGRNDPKGKELYRISKLFGVSIDWLLTGVESASEDSATQMWRKRAIAAEEKLDMIKSELKRLLESF